MEKKEPKMQLPKITLDDLFSVQAERDDEKLEKILNIKISDIDNFKNHPFKVIDNAELHQLVDSIKEKGVISPVIVRPLENGRYELISGHRRKLASEYANIDTIPCIVRDLTDDEATILMVDSNLQREKLLPSEKGFAYKMKLEALKHQGKRTDLTSTQFMSKLRTNELLGKEVGESREKIRQFIRLTELIPELLERVDNEQMALGPAVAISYLLKEEQKVLLKFIDCNYTYPSIKQAKELKKLSEDGELDSYSLDEIMSVEKPNQKYTIKLDEGRMRRVLPKEIKKEEIENFVIKSIEYYRKFLDKQKNMGAR